MCFALDDTNSNRLNAITYKTAGVASPDLDKVVMGILVI